MDSSNDNFDDLFPEERPDARHALLELFPEEAEELKEKRAEEIFERIQPKIEAALSELASSIGEGLDSLQTLMQEHSDESEDIHDSVKEQLEKIGEELQSVAKIQTALAGLGQRISNTKSLLAKQIETTSKTTSEIAYRALNRFNDLNEKFGTFSVEIYRAHARIDNLPEPYDDTDVWKELEELRKLFLSLPRGGGGAFRNIAVGGNSSVLGRYNDLNIKAGANVTLTYANNDQTHFLDLTISSSGGGSSVSGTVRSINNISTSQTAGSTSGTDYVYICSAGVQLTLPDAVANTNLYTVKNTSTSSVLVSTTAGETIDTASNLILPVQYTSVDLISDGANWDIT